jgi:regulator of protease activity HflC (stomatin/prohibitin superfamily)
VARITPVNALAAEKCRDGSAWNDLKNSRRCELVDREIEGTLLPDEAAELAVLQQQMLAERRRLAPVPLNDLRRLHQELLAKAERAANGNL